MTSGAYEETFLKKTFPFFFFFKKGNNFKFHLAREAALKLLKI